MENYKQTNGYTFVRSAYYTGKLLHAADFIRDQDYVDSKLEFINRKFHGWGIIEGLEVQVMRNGSLHLSRGSAIDSCGRILAVSEDRRVMPDEIEKLRPEGHEFILGIRYAKQTVETERDYLEKGECYRTSVIADAYALRAFEKSEFWRLKSEVIEHENILTEERVLYDNGALTLVLRIPKVVPTDSFFRIRIQVRAVQENNIRIGWRGMAKLQGAIFAQTGAPFFALEEEPAMCSGTLQREWEICTEENRNLQITLEISNLEIVTGNEEIVEIPTCQFHIETTSSYNQVIKSCLQNRTEQDRKADWVPLACLRLEESVEQNAENGKYVFSLSEEKTVRFTAIRPCEEELLRRIMEENGILDIRWRKLLKHMWRSPLSPPVPGLPISPVKPVPPFQPQNMPQEGTLTEQQFWELITADRESRISRGVTVIPVPKRYKKGQILFSEEVSHGFPGEEVFLWCSRVREERSYAYWDRNRKRYRVIHGDEELFPEACDGQEILRQAILQNVEEGTFQVALTLSRRKRRNRSREVAISWIAVRSV